MKHYSRINQRMTFGIHQGITIKDIISAKPWYLQSLIKYGHITLSLSLKKKLDKRSKDLAQFRAKNK